MSTEPLGLFLGERQLQQTGNCRKFISWLQENAQQMTASPTIRKCPDELNCRGWRSTHRIGSLNPLHSRRAIRDGRASNAQLARPSPPPNLQESLRLSTPPPPQDGGQPNVTCQQLPFLHNPATGYLLSNTTVSSGLASLSSSIDISDPAQVSSFHLNFRQPSLTSHLIKANSMAITNGEHMNFATLLPMTSLVTDTIHSHLNLKVGDEGLTIPPLPNAPKSPLLIGGSMLSPSISPL